MDKKRLNAYITDDIKRYIDKQCDYYGISQGAFISIVMQQYRQQNEALNTMKKITSDDILNKIRGDK